MSNLLVHCCCVHCSSYTLKYWQEIGHQVTAFWYNPNIHPYTEHQRRLEALKVLTSQENIPLVISPTYEVERYFRAIAGHEANRCLICYQVRLQAVAGYARHNGYDAFTSSLLISPQQKHDKVIDVASEIERSSGIRFQYADLRKRYSESRRITKPMELYPQQYCGCLFSEWERYRDEPSGANGIED